MQYENSPILSCEFNLPGLQVIADGVSHIVTSRHQRPSPVFPGGHTPHTKPWGVSLHCTSARIERQITALLLGADHFFTIPLCTWITWLFLTSDYSCTVCPVTLVTPGTGSTSRSLGRVVTRYTLKEKLLIILKYIPTTSSWRLTIYLDNTVDLYRNIGICN